LKNVRLENVRVAIVTETILRRWYVKRGGELEDLIAAGVTTREAPQALFLYARPARPIEKGRTLNGGLICNLTETEETESLLLDKYEFEPVLKRARVPKLKIGDGAFFPEHITFYAGTENFDDITVEEKKERSVFLDLNRKPGAQSPQARWKKDVRHAPKE
jgi:hypothetical protein